MKNNYSPYDQTLLTVFDRMRSEHPGKTIAEAYPDEIEAGIRHKLEEGSSSKGKTDSELAEAYRAVEAEVILKKANRELQETRLVEWCRLRDRRLRRTKKGRAVLASQKKQLADMIRYIQAEENGF